MKPSPGGVDHKARKDSSRKQKNLNMTHQNLVDVIDVDDEDDQVENASKQLVLYDAVPDPAVDHIGSFRSFMASSPSSKVLPSVGAFTVQCAACYKWRLVPTKEKYEEIRENLLQEGFVCGRAREWRSNISCDDPADIYQDDSRLWAIDVPNISQPPPGWERILRIRSKGSTKFADIYYAAPSGKRFRSMVEIQNYLLDHPEYTRDGVNISQFSFQIPKPLQENYVRKRSAQVTDPYDNSVSGLPTHLEPSDVNPLAWVYPHICTELQLGGPGLSSSPSPAKKRAVLPRTTTNSTGRHRKTGVASKTDHQLRSPFSYEP